MKSQELRFTETNSADDSQGKTWGLDGNLFWYIAGGSFVSVITLLLLFSASTARSGGRGASFFGILAIRRRESAA